MKSGPLAAALRFSAAGDAAFKSLCLVSLIVSTSARQSGEWTVPVAENLPVIEHTAVADAQRTRHVEFVRELVIGLGSGDSNYMFYEARNIAVDAGRNIFVLDTGNNRVQVFDAAGQFLRTIGSEGAGPGQFMYPSTMAINGARLYVGDSRLARLSVFDLEGNLIEDRRADRRRMDAEALSVLDDGRLLVRYHDGDIRGSQEVIARISPSGEIEESYIDWTRRFAIMRKERDYQIGVLAGFVLPAPRPSLAFDATGRAYLMRGDRYEILALDEEGTPRWAIRVDAAVVPFTESYVDRLIERARQQYPDLTATMFEAWRPESFPVLASIAVDGQSRLWVFPWAQLTPDPPRDVPVDIYSPDGELLLAAMMPNLAAHCPQAPACPMWRAAEGNRVYTIETDDESEEQVVVRYRLVLPREE